MTTRAVITAAPTTFKLGGKLFQMSPMTDEDHGIMDRWIQSRHVSMARETLPADAPDKQRELTERVALSQASTMTFMSGAGVLLMKTAEGAAMLFWCGIRRNHPDMTPEDVRALLMQPGNLNKIQAEWNRINNEMSPPSKKKKKAKKKGKRKAIKKSRQKNRST